MIDTNPHRLIEARLVQLVKWLEDEAPYVQFDQNHLDAGSPEQAYWHLGYQSGLADVLKMLKDAMPGSDGTSNHSPAAGPDA